MNHYENMIWIVLLIGFVLYRRIKRSIGFQEFNKKRLVARNVIFISVSILLLLTGLVQPIAYLFDGLGIVIGLVLVKYATKHSVFEKREEKIFYRTHIWIESIVLGIFLCRFAYRMIEMAQMQGNVQITHDTYTGGVVLLLATYYIGFHSFVLKRAKDL